MMGHTVPKMSKLFIAVCIVAFLSACVGQIVVEQCDDPNIVMKNFDPDQYAGTWYVIESLDKTEGTCNIHSWTKTAEGLINLRNSRVVDQVLHSVTGTATQTEGASTGSAKYTVSITSANGDSTTSDYWVLDTDYDTYALVYSCQEIEENEDTIAVVHAWKLGRNTGPLPQGANSAINDIIDKVPSLKKAADSNYFVERDHSAEGCYTSVVLPGACPTVTGVSDFDLNRFIGRWHEIARYPNEVQTGQCNRAVYTAGTAAGVVSVENSEVNDEALTTISGHAIATAQSGVLDVSLNVEGENRNLDIYVLATDYDYALLYSCANLPENRRRISSWKLKRTATPLTNDQNTELNKAIAAIDGFDSVYFQDTKRTDEACFYYPKADELSDFIEFRGSCPTDITGIPDFNLHAYLGTWYEVARYPQPVQTGQCNRVVYTLRLGGVSVVNSQVADEVLATVSGQIRTIGTSGDLVVMYDIDGVPITTNFHVLATDYDNYALVYSCVNVRVDGENRRRVGSWKLSRNTSPLDEEANAVVNDVISATQGLNEDYYRSTSQTNDACFHYPEQTGNKVIIPGQCNTAFAGVANIDLSRFSNGLVWYQIQSYDAVEGTCIGTRLTLDGDNISLNYIERLGNEVRLLRGEAQLSSIETGRFTLKMEDSEEEEELYILATDYDSYAIAYNCENVGTNERRIGAWQLSRGRTMPPAGQEALNLLIAERQEFTDRPNYFKEILHPNPPGDGCPEPSSASLFKSSIIVILVCAILQLEL